VVTGCYATRRRDEVAGLPNVAAVVANDDKPRLIEIVRSVDQMTTADRFGGGEGACGAPLAPGVGDRTAFTLRVQTGCAERCTYCIIPATRGRPRSVPIDHALRETARVAEAGYKEIVLTGVHLGSYGRDLAPAVSLLDLLRALAARTRGVRFRISSLEPMDCPPELVDLVAAEPCFAPHFHLPLQHASERMLSAMGRPYTVHQYAALVDRIRDRMPGASIGSDLIVGFPGETDADFESLAGYLPRSPLTHVHVFPYSDRPGTAASAMGGRTHGSVVRERGARLRAIGRELVRRFRESQVGTVHRGLTLEDGTLVVTGNYLKVRIGPGLPRNEWVTVRVNGEGELAHVIG
jgi:threonylcarbamoyladenosine tRNA methylthiotransferase MtaB